MLLYIRPLLVLRSAEPFTFLHYFILLYTRTLRLRFYTILRMFKLTGIVSAVATAFLFSLSTPHCLTLAAPLDVVGRDSKIVFNPRITYPDGAAIWSMGSIQNVTWGILLYPFLLRVLG